MVYYPGVMKVIKIDEKEYQRILEIDKKNRNQRIDQKLRVLKLRYEGASNREISLRTGYNERYITKLMGDYAKQGLEEFLRIKHTSHYRLLSENEEAEILAGIEKEAEAGTVLTIGNITAAIEEKLGRKASKMYIYRLLRRHGWRKIMPRSRHPKAADKEAVNASKKLKPDTTN